MNVPVAKLLCEARRVFEALAEAADDALLSSGISSREYALLKVLARESEPIGVAAIARVTLTPISEAGLALSALQTRGWLECHGNARDSSGTTVALSALGRAHWAQLLADEQFMFQRLNAMLDAQSTHSTCVTLRTVRRLLQRTVAPVTAPRPGADFPSRAGGTRVDSIVNGHSLC